MPGQNVHVRLVSAIVMAALAIALLDLPYGYYVLLRLVVCGVCIYLAVDAAGNGKSEWAWLLGGCAVLYNPIIKFPLGREIWPFVNLATIALLGVHIWSFGGSGAKRS